jgi:hypothetical protein
MSEYTQLLDNINIAIKNEVGKILLPFFETMQRDKENMKLIENVLKQMPEFKRLEAENQELKQRLMVPAPAALALVRLCLRLLRLCLRLLRLCLRLCLQ